MSVFDLDDTARRQLDDIAGLKMLRPEDQKPTAWAGSDEALKGLLRPSAGAGRSLLLAGSVVPQTYDRFASLATGRDVTGMQEFYFREVVDGWGSNATDYWTANPDAMGAAAKAINVGGNVVGSLPQLFGTPALFLGTSALDPSADLIRKGVDAENAATVGGINLAANAIGLRLPAAFGLTLTQRIATGAGSNLALGVAADAGSAAALDSGGYKQQAAGYDAADPYARTLDVLMGAAFGFKAHVDAPRVMTPSQRDAVLTARNNDHQHRQTLPGQPVSAAAERAHVDALSQAINQVLRGEQVEIASAINPADFVLRPELAPQAAAGPVDYVAYRRTLESGGRANARASTSSAYGIDQFTAGTWRRIVAQERPAWAQGLSDAELLAARGDPDRSGQMAEALDRQNAAALEAAGEPASPHNLYAAHHFGDRAGVRFAQAADDVRMERILTKEQIAANPYLRGKRKGEVLDLWDERARKGGAEVPVRDVAVRDAEPAAPRFDAPEAGRIIDARLATLDELSMQRLPDAELQVLQREDAALVDQIRQQERYQRDNIVPADPTARLAPAEFEQLSTRRAEIRQQVEQHRGAVGYEQQATQLRQRLDRIERDDDLQRLAERLAGDAAPLPRPERQPETVRTTGNLPDRPTGEPVFGGGSLDLRPDQPAARTLPGAGTVTAARVTGAPPPMPPARTADTAAADNGTAEPARAAPRAESAPEADTAFDNALRVATENPSLQVVDGFDADGAPRYRPVSEVLAELEAERVRAEADAQAFPAAVSCFLRLGQG